MNGNNKIRVIMTCHLCLQLKIFTIENFNYNYSSYLINGSFPDRLTTNSSLYHL